MNISLKPKIALKLNPDRSTSLPPYRRKILTLLEATQLRSDLIPLVEQYAYEHAGLDTTMDSLQNNYLGICRHLYDNLRLDNSICNRGFVESLNTEHITPQQAVMLSPQDMYPERWKTLIDKQNHELDSLGKSREETTNAYWCPKCHRNKCTFFLRQDRSSDEPMTAHVTCCYEHCGNKFRR